MKWGVEVEEGEWNQRETTKMHSHCLRLSIPLTTGASEYGDGDFLHAREGASDTVLVEQPVRIQYPTRPSDGDVRFAAERTDGAVVNGRSAIGTPPFEKLAADRAVFAADRIFRRTVGTEIDPPVDLVTVMRRTFRIRTESARVHRDHDRLRHDRRRNLLLRLLQLDAELLRELTDHLVVELRPVPATFEHRQGRLLAADFGRQHTLGKPGLAAGVPQLAANLWTKIDHGE